MGIRERQDRERQAVTAAILDAARALFVTDGFANVSIRRIAERIEYSPAAIYSYFPSKDDIFLALAEEGFHRLDAKVRGAQVHVDAMANVRAGWWAFYEFSKEQPEYFELMFVGREVPRITEQWSGFSLLRRLMEDAAAAIERAIGEGALPATVSPRAAIHLLWSALIGPAVVGLRHRLSPGEDCDALARDVLDATLAGLRSGVVATFIPCESLHVCGAAQGPPVAEPAPSAGARDHES